MAVTPSMTALCKTCLASLPFSLTCGKLLWLCFLDAGSDHGTKKQQHPHKLCETELHLLRQRQAHCRSLLICASMRKPSHVDIKISLNYQGKLESQSKFAFSVLTVQFRMYFCLEDVGVI